MRLTEAQKSKNKALRRLNLAKDKYTRVLDAQKNQKPVKAITIKIEWKKSKTWGANPHCTADVSFKDGTFERSEVFTCSGCGYDKESTVIAEVFNKYLGYKLFQGRKIKGMPYVIRHSKYSLEGFKQISRRFEGGVGTSCYYRIGDYVGGKFECIASGNSFDVFTYTNA